MVTKHTPGPWILDRTDGVVFIEAKNAETVREVIAKVWLQEPDRSLANAHLIAAAPQLFQALEQLEKVFFNLIQGQESKYYELTAARAAIRKAKGDP